MFLLVKKCILVLLSGSPGQRKGCFINPPFHDAHGEVDVGLRRGRPQFLAPRRLAELRALALAQGIPSFVARKLDATLDRGGWETL